MERYFRIQVMGRPLIGDGGFPSSALYLETVMSVPLRFLACVVRDLFVALVVVGGIGVPSAAASTSSDATKQIAKASKAALKTLASSLKNREGVLDSSLSIVEQKLQNGTAILNDASSLVFPLEQFQVGVRADVATSSSQMEIGVQQAMLTLATAGVPSKDEPKGFRYGEKGPLGDYRTKVESTLAKHYAKVRARLDSIQKGFTTIGFSLCVYLVPPQIPIERMVTAYQLDPGYPDSPLTIDLIVATSDLTKVFDATLSISGSAKANSQVNLQGWSATGSWGFGTLATSASGRWSHQLTSWQEGNYGFQIHPAVGPGAGIASIGVR